MNPNEMKKTNNKSVIIEIKKQALFFLIEKFSGEEVRQTVYSSELPTE